MQVEVTSDLRSSLLEALARDGFAVVRRALTEAEFRALTLVLGTPGWETNVELRDDVQTYLCQPAPVPLHTDHPDARFIAWRCVRQDAVDGAMLLVDSQPLWRDEGLAALRSTLERCELRTGWGPDTARSIHPVLVRDGERFRVFFAPWLRAAGAGGAGELAAALEQFGELLQDPQRVASGQVRLAPGEVLVVDNHRVLHGRGALAPGSPRLLQRVWIRETQAQ